jgi:indole-3-glycerol phosphate synthase
VCEEDPVEVAIAMVEGGATALSVLTEPEFFKGSIEALERVRAAVDIPILRKDFILKEAHLDAVESDLVLIIASFVDNLEELYHSAKERGFEVLLEVHCEKEIEMAVDMGAEIIGINNRNIKNLEVNLETFEKLADKIPDKTTLIAESGISNERDAMRMYNAGADGLLIGTAIMEGKIKQNTERFTQIKI